MARIRTIKPEFPHSESMGRISRDARLTFIQLWTLADDSGRLRGNSRMLASLLYPYDEDAPNLIDTWMAELEGEGCLIRYQVDGSNYVQIRNWLNHQKIDKPSKSKLPEFVETSRIFAKPRDRSSGDRDQGSRIKEGIKDQGSDLKNNAASASSMSRGTRIPIPFVISDSMRKWAADELPGFAVDAPTVEFVDYWRAISGSKGVKLDWIATWRNRMREVQGRSGRRTNGHHTHDSGIDEDGIPTWVTPEERTEILEERKRAN